MEQSKKEECCDIRVNGGLQSPDCCHQNQTIKQMKTAEEVLAKYGYIRPPEDILKAMKEYASEALREAAERALVSVEDTGLPNYTVDFTFIPNTAHGKVRVSKQSILKLITELK